MTQDDTTQPNTSQSIRIWSAELDKELNVIIIKSLAHYQDGKITVIKPCQTTLEKLMDVMVEL
jgi:hypothetical protein